MLLIVCFSWTALLDVTFNQNMKMSFTLKRKRKTKKLEIRLKTVLNF